MTEPAGHEITELLQAWREGDERALEKLTPEVYRELHNAARRCMAREHDGHTLQTTALINELYLRLSDLREVETAEVLKVSPDTVARDWRLAKAWLLREMGGKTDGS